MVVRKGELEGPFKSEKQFKAAVIAWYKSRPEIDYVFEIENEEKEPGMPDLLVTSGSEYSMVEVKFSSKSSTIKFQKSQPLFYRRHPYLNVVIIAWDSQRNCAVQIEPAEILETKALRYRIPLKHREEKEEWTPTAG
jgi:Holliday junction resolvase